MILIWFGSFAMMLLGVWIFRLNLEKIMAESLAQTYPKLTHEKSTWPLMVRTVFVSLVSTPQQNLRLALIGWNLRLIAKRNTMILLCLTHVGVFLSLALGFLYLKFNGLFLLSAALLLLTPLKPSFKLRVSMVAALGVFLLGSEMSLKNMSVIQSTLGQSSWAFFLADGRFSAVGFLALVSLALSFFVQLQGWSLFLGIALVTGGVISFNGALGLILGEIICFSLSGWWYARHFAPIEQSWTKIWSGLGIVGGLLGFWLAGEIRAFNYEWAQSSQLSEKTGLLVICAMTMYVLPLILQMTWGHFACKKEIDEAPVRYLHLKAFKAPGLTSVGETFVLQKFAARLSEIRYHWMGVQNLKPNEVPSFMLERLQREMHELEALDKGLKG